MFGASLLLFLFRHGDGDFLGDHRGIVGDVSEVSEYQLQGVFAGRQFQHRLSLAAAVVDEGFASLQRQVHGR